MFTEKVESVEEGLAWLLEAARSGELPVARLKDLVAASRSWEAKVSALQTDSARLIARQESHGDGGASVLRDQAGKSNRQARRNLGTSETLDAMTGLRSAVDAGEVSLANAERLADAAQRTSPEVVDSASDLLAQAKELPPDRFAREVGAWTQRHQTDHGHEDWLNKRRQRYLRTWKRQDGMVRLDGLLDPETGARICSRLEGTAEQLRRQDQQSARTGNSSADRGFSARDRGCIGCGAEPSRCQAHHVVLYAQSRRTDINNLVLVCWKCHHNIHDHNWQVTHRNGKPALQPPDPHAPPHTPAEESSQTTTRQAGGWHGGKPCP